MPTKSERPTVPNFATEAEEAKWWDDNQDMVEEEMLKAIRDGTAHIGGPARILLERRESKDISIRVPIADLERAREQAQKKGLTYQTYIKMLLHEALDRQDAASQS
jgi:predicted DNA binding CopG/RHH family protein